MRRGYLFAAMVLLAACTEGKFMNYERYQGVSIGENIVQIELSTGRPYEIKDIGSSQQEYVFIERIPLADGREMFRRYVLVVEHSRVIKKYISEEVTSVLMLHG
jgi:hypothetical protein